MRKTEMISLGLMLVLFAGLFTGLGAAETTAQNDSTRGTGPAIVPERSSADEIGTSPAVKLAEVLNSTAMKQGYFAPVAEVSATGRPGFEYYDPVSRSACFDSEGTYVLHSGANESVALFSSFVGSSAASLEGLDPINTRITRMIGRNESNWVRPQGYQSIQWTDLWPGVDLVYTGVPGGLKSQFWFDRGSDYRSIAINISGAQALEVSADGSELTILTSAGSVTESAWAWEQGSGQRIEINYTIMGTIIAFDVSDEVPWENMVIDPLIYSSYFGGNGLDSASDVVVDNDGFAHVTGYSASLDFPVTAGAYNESNSGQEDIIVFKLNKTGSNLIYCTFIGGNRDDRGTDITIDDVGNAYILGTTGSGQPNSFPVTSGSFNESVYSEQVIVLKLSANGSTLTWSGTLGGTGFEGSAGLVIDPVTGEVIACGHSQSTDFQMTTGAYMTTNPGNLAIFVARISPDGSTLLNCTYYGGVNEDAAFSVSVNSTSYVYFAGRTNNTSLPTPGNPFNDTHSGGQYDLIYGCFSPNLSVLHVAGYIGGSNTDDRGYIVAGDEHIVLVGTTLSDDFPTTSGTFNESRWGDKDVTVSVLNERLDTLENSTYIGGSGLDEPSEVIVDVDGSIYVSGYTDSVDFPMLPWSYQAENNGSNDGFIIKLTQNLEDLKYSTYLGGTGSDYCWGFALLNDSSVWGRDIYMAGRTLSPDFPVTVGAFNGTYGGNGDMFVAAIAYLDPRPVIQDVNYPNSIEYHQNWVIYANVTSQNGLSEVKLHYNSSYFDMSNASTPENWNYSASVRTTSTGSNSFTVWANGTLGNITETASYSFYIGDVPKFASISGDSAIAPAVPWTVEARVTDELVGDSGVAGVHFRLDSGDWEPMSAEGDVYTADSRSFSDEGTYYWQLRAIDSVGNIAYSSSYKLVVSEETLPTTAAAAVVTTANGTPPWVPTYKADWGWWVYSGIFSAGILLLALFFGRKKNVVALVIILTCTAAGIMAAASLAGISRVFEWQVVAALWAGIGVWAVATAKKKLPAFAAGLAIGSGALGVEMLISSGWNLAVAMYICLAAAGAVWALGPKAKIIPKQRFSIPIAVGVLMAAAVLLGLWYVFV